MNPLLVLATRWLLFATSNPGDDHHSPSRSASNRNGFDVLNNQIRSIFAHPLGLPLAAMFNRQILAPTSKYPVAAYYAEDGSFAETAGDDILLASYGEYETRMTTETPWTKAQLTQVLCEKIREHFGQHFSVAQHRTPVKCAEDHVTNTDILISTNFKGVPAMPVAILELGLKSGDWMQTFDQGVTYLRQEKRFTKPLLLAIVTLDKSSTGDFKFSICVFLCYRRQENAAAAADDEDNNFRLSLVWKHQDTNKEDASKSFGSFLRNLNRFQKWRVLEVPMEGFEYLSCNCCKVGKWVRGRPAACSLFPRQRRLCLWFYLNVCLFDCLIDFCCACHDRYCEATIRACAHATSARRST